MSNLKIPLTSPRDAIYCSQMTPLMSDLQNSFGTSENQMKSRNFEIFSKKSEPTHRTQSAIKSKKIIKNKDTAVAGAMRALQNTIKKLEIERDNLKEENEKLKEKNLEIEKNLKSDITHTEKKLMNALKEINERNFEFEKMSEEYSRIKKENEKMKQKLAKSNEKCQVLSDNLISLENENKKLKEEIYENEKNTNKNIRKITNDSEQKYSLLKHEYELYKEVNIQKISELESKLEQFSNQNFEKHSYERCYLDHEQQKIPYSFSTHGLQDEIKNLEEIILSLNEEYNKNLNELKNAKLTTFERLKIKEKLSYLSEIIEKRSEDLIFLKQSEIL